MRWVIGVAVFMLSLLAVFTVGLFLYHLVDRALALALARLARRWGVPTPTGYEAPRLEQAPKEHDVRTAAH
jgi:hypothetical protein